MVAFFRIAIFFFLSAALLPSCGREGSGAERKVCTNCDTLYLGYRFGMDQEEFFDHCGQLNREGILYEGDELNTVTQEVDFTVKARIYIKPVFDDAGKIFQLDMLFQYNVLPMFRPDLTPVKLRKETLAFMEQATGKKLKPKEHPVLKHVWENVEGYRRVRLFHEGEWIKVEYYDLRHQVTG